MDCSAVQQIVVGGIEGGGTHSTLVLVDANGNTLVTVGGQTTNHWLIGMPECQRRIATMVQEAKQKAGIPDCRPLSVLGLCLSGCGDEDSNTKLMEDLKTNYPQVAHRIVVRSDTDGSVATIAQSGGIVMISGTGSNCLLINPDGERFQCGGWGHMLGDEGSAYWIAHRAIKTVFDDHDGLRRSPHPVDWVWQAIKDHFNVETQTDLLEYMYTNFEKHKIAGLCKTLAGGAKEGDKLCLLLFEEAGQVLAQALIPQFPKAADDLKNRPGGLQVLCVGSVWKSWDLMEPGFVPMISRVAEINELSLSRLTVTSAMGAVYLAADKYGFPIPKTYEENHHVFYHFNK